MLALRTVLSLEEVLRILLVQAALPAQAAPPPPTAPPAQHANSAVNLPRPILQLAHCAASRLPTALLLAPQRSRTPSGPTRLLLTTPPAAPCCWASPI